MSTVTLTFLAVSVPVFIAAISNVDCPPGVMAVVGVAENEKPVLGVVANRKCYNKG